MSTRRSLTVLGLAVAFAIIAGCSTPTPLLQFTQAGVSDGSRPLVGYLKHRGRLYAISDLMNRRSRAESEVGFVRDIDIDTVCADLWVGTRSASRSDLAIWRLRD